VCIGQQDFDRFVDELPQWHGARVGYLFRLLGLSMSSSTNSIPDSLFRRTFAPSRDDDLVAFPMQRFSETAPDA
jgi:hypothetical protein